MFINPYLAFDGDCAAALTHYQTVFGGDLVLMNFRGSPMEAHMPPDRLDRIMHGRVTAGSMVLMASDAPSDDFRPMHGIMVSVNVDTAEEAERVWAGLSEGGEVKMPLAETFWALRFGMLTDRFGTPWMVNCEKAKG